MSVPLRVEVGPPTGVEVAPDLWGLFFEDINTSLDGGLNAELVRNGDFEFDELDHPGWSALTGWTVEGAGSVQLRDEDPLHPNTRHYLRVTGPVRLVNDGWDGVGATVGDRWRLSLATWSVFGRGGLAAQVVDGDEVLAEAEVELPPRGWNWVQADLVATAPGRGRLTLDVPAGLTVELDGISLRPLDESGEVLTFRPDLVTVLADLNPRFVRFPGGCVAHGLGLANMYRWKDTIGPRHTRVQARNLWGYHQSRQVGYLEFFELCEQLGATAVPVVPAGVCCQNVRGGPVALPEDQMADYVAEVLDLVEFANGPVDSRWGAVRAELGHPQPFGLRYLGVGNEDAITADFRSRYAQIEDALRAANPEVVVVGTVGPMPFGPDFDAGWEFARERRIAIVDEHAYRTPRWFHQNVDRYDHYRRDESGVYFGEYAARSNTVRSALAEAAFMIGMERNSDVVRLASYAPLLARVGATQWVPDLVYFDADTVMPSASYHAQGMFSRLGLRDAGEGSGVGVVRSVVLEGGAPVPVGLPIGGSVRVSSPTAGFEVTDVVLDAGSVASVSTSAGGDPVVLGEIDPSRATLDLVARRVEGAGGLHVQLGAEGLGSFVELVVPSWSGRESVVYRHDDGISADDDGPRPWRNLDPDERLPIRIVLAGTRVQVWLAGELQHDYEQDLRPEQRVVVGAISGRRLDDQSGEQVVVRLVNATAEPRATTVVVQGTGHVTGTATVLGGADPDQGAPFEESPMTPVEHPVSGESGRVQLELPPWSFTVFDLTASDLKELA